MFAGLAAHKTDDGWNEARNHNSENPGIEEGPEEIKALMDNNKHMRILCFLWFLLLLK
jgi:hypothetical protein